MDYVQSLYEKKLITYPRTDSRFLTADMEVNLPELIKKIVDKFGYHGALVANYKQVINNKKVSDHHAIIPTLKVYDVNFGELPSGEQKILSLVVTRILAGIGEPHVIAETELEFDCAGYPLKAKAKQVVKNSWKDVVEWILGGKKKKDEDSDEDKILQNLHFFEEGKSIPARESECKEGKTSPKKHFTDVIHFESRQWKYSKCKGAG